MAFAMTRRIKTRALRKDGAKTLLRRQLITLVALLAFVFQGFATQTHIHRMGQVDVAFFGNALAKIGAASAATPQKSNTDKLPPLNDPVKCPLCHEMALAGHYVSPAPPQLLLPVFLVQALIIAARASAHIAQNSHDWLSRGPPRA
ncbi:MAG TPA: hypothetical protein VFI93_12805 [Rhizomicrobium sp.]|nr:hypothetical protein [Rhizomicrobium sp.]